MKRDPRCKCELCGKYKQEVGANWILLDMQVCNECFALKALAQLKILDVILPEDCQK